MSSTWDKSVVVMTFPRWHSSTMRPSRRELLDRLKTLEGAGSDEELAQKLKMKIRTLSRWKTDPSWNYDKTIELLDRAGVLSWDPSDVAPDPEMAALLKELEDAFGDVLGRMRSLLARQARQTSSEGT